MLQESQKISVPYNGILPINIKQVPQYSPIPVDTLVWMSRLKSLDSFVCTYCYNHPVERWWIDRRTIRAGLVSDGECVCLPSTPMIKHGKWKFGTVVPATQTRDQVFYFQWIIQCSQSSDFFSVIITPAFLIFFSE